MHVWSPEDLSDDGGLMVSSSMMLGGHIVLSQHFAKAGSYKHIKSSPYIHYTH